MSKELPKMYQNKFNKDIPNIQKVYSTLYDERNRDYSVNEFSDHYTILQKIYNIFKSPTYVYKVDVIITTKEGKFTKRIVGKNKDNLITIDNEYIPINKILDIDIK